MDAVRDGIDRLVKRCIADPELRKLLGSHKVDGDGIKKLYDTLLVSGAGQWAGRRWVPADALLTPATLAELLDRWSDAHTDWTEVSWQLLRRYGVS